MPTSVDAVKRFMPSIFLYTNFYTCNVIGTKEAFIQVGMGVSIDAVF